MPYIKPEERKVLRPDIDKLSANIETPGQLNYVISVLCHQYAIKKGEKYATYNEIIGVLECAKQEYYRIQVSPYETQKRSANGDVLETGEEND